MFRGGIQSVDLSKIRCSAEDKKKSGIDKENKLSDVYRNKYRIPLNREIQELFLMSFFSNSGFHLPAML